MTTRTIGVPDSQDVAWMSEALLLAKLARAEGEVPIGAVVVRGDKILGRGWNRNIGLHDPSAHAEVLAMREAGIAVGNHRHGNRGHGARGTPLYSSCLILAGLYVGHHPVFA
jgi:tRNA(adenine34) deaminase